MYTKKTRRGFLKSILTSIIIVGLSLPALLAIPNQVQAAVLEGAVSPEYTIAMGREKGFDGIVQEVVPLPDGSFIAVGGFQEYNEVSTRGIAKINASGILDTDFSINIGTGIPNSTSVSGVALQADGKIVIIGGFTTFNGVSANRILRLNADGTRDGTFTVNTGFNDYPRMVSIRSDGKIVVGGDFTSYRGSSINRIALINSDGSIDTDFRTALGTGPNALVTTARLQPDDKIILSGNFTSIASTSVNRIARLNADGTIDSSFVTNVGTGINSNAGASIVLSDGHILLGGSLTTFNGTATAGAVKLNADGTLDTAFTTGFTAGTVSDFIELEEGKVLAVGAFTTYKGVTRRGVVLLNTDLSADATFTTTFGSGFSVGSPNSVIRLTDGSLVFAGSFSTVTSRQMAYILKTNVSGVVDSAFDPNFGFGFNESVSSVVQRPDGTIIYSGNFTRFSNEATRLNTSVTRLAQFDPSYVLDTTFNANIGSGLDSGAGSLVLQPDGKLILGGGFTTFDGVSSNKILRLNANGTRDATFVMGTGFNNSVSAVALQPDGKIIVGGTFTTYKGSTNTRIARLNADGSIDSAFRTNIGTGASGTVTGIAIQPDGKIVLVGAFATFNGVTVNKIVRLNADGTADAAFTTNAGAGFAGTSVYDIKMQSDGKFVVVGPFTSYAGVAVGDIARVNADGTPDTDFIQNIGTSGTAGPGYPSSVVIQSDGKMVISGDFTSFKSVTRNRIFRLNANGTIDSSFSSNNNGGFNYGTYSLTLLSDNNILATGYFTRSGPTYANQVSLLLGPEMIPPDVPPPTNLDAASDTGKSSTDNITSDTTPTFSGTASTSASIYLYSVATTTNLVGTTTSDGSGNYSATSSSLADGQYSMVIVQELFGVRSATSSPITVTIDTTAPNLFSLTPTDDSTDVSISTSLRIRLNESIATTSGTIRLYKSADDSLVQSASTASNDVSIQSGHSLVFEPASSLQYNTEYYVMMDAGVLSDIAGNQYAGLTASSSWMFTTMATPTPSTPGRPDLVEASDTGASTTDNITSDNTPTFSGTVTANALVSLYRTGSILLGTTTANGSGSYSFTSPVLSDGVYGITVVQEVLGARSATSSILSITIDTTTPPAPIVDIVDGSVSSEWNPSISWGDADVCMYSINASLFTTAACSENGSDIPSPGSGTHILVLNAYRYAGNVSVSTTTFTIQAPVTPTPNPEPNPNQSGYVSSSMVNSSYRPYPTLTSEEVRLMFGISPQSSPTLSASTTPVLPSKIHTTSTYEFVRDLSFGSTGADVKVLQMFLNLNGFLVSSVGAGSIGNETTYFGPATRTALAKFQSAKGIRPAVGYFGPITRGVVKRINAEGK